MSTLFFASATARIRPQQAFPPPRAKPVTPEPDNISTRQESVSTHPASSSSLPRNSFAAEEHRTAGQPYNQEFWPFPFPHAALKETAQATSPPSRSHTSMSLDSDLSNTVVSSQSDESRSEAVPKPQSSSDATLRQQHYAVLTSLLHRCLMERDYMRASRAWGILLRLEIHGHPLDIRAQERWGIGAECLLHANGNDKAQPSLENLMRAKDYYERLILQYPYRKHSPDVVSALTFYPVTFGIWIYAVQLRYQIAVSESVGRSRGDGSSGAVRVSENEVERLVSTFPSTPTGALLIEARRVAVEEANEVIKKLSELLISPPYSDHSGLWKTQGMLYLWLSQMLNQTHTENSQERQEALHQSSDAFSRAIKEGGTIDTTMLESLGL
ncbi:MAG: hypothetical protein Q9169_001999 [Polycauliona sp. 2 TL-2023]